MKNVKISNNLLLCFVLVAFVALGNGMSDGIYGNYFKDAYNVTTAQRAFIEFPRELPGILCVFIIGALSFLGDFKLAVIAQILACFGLTVLGLFTPSFNIMLIFLFINSLGMHLFMPLQDSMVMSLAEPDQIGKRIGQYSSIKIGIGFLSGIIVFIGFRTGLFSFVSEFKLVFIIGALSFVIATMLALKLVSNTKNLNRPINKNRISLIFRKEYKYYYMLTVLHGVQKQIAYVFGSWVIIDLLLKGADVMSLLVITGNFIGMFFMAKLGKWIDKYGVKSMLYLDALTFIIIYTIYGFIVWNLTGAVDPGSSWMVMVVYLLFISDRLSMQIGVVKSVYLKSIAVDPNEVTATLSTGISLDHMVAIVAAQISGLIWTNLGPQWVFFIAAFLSFGNLFVAWKIEPAKHEKK